MAAVTIRSDFKAQEEEICHCFQFSPSFYHEMMGPDGQWLLVHSELYSHQHYLILEHFCYPLPQET